MNFGTFRTSDREQRIFLKITFLRATKGIYYIPKPTFFPTSKRVVGTAAYRVTAFTTLKQNPSLQKAALFKYNWFPELVFESHQESFQRPLAQVPESHSCGFSYQFPYLNYLHFSRFQLSEDTIHVKINTFSWRHLLIKMLEILIFVKLWILKIMGHLSFLDFKKWSW